MTVATLRDVISDLILEHAELKMDGGNVYVANSDTLADLILKRIQETHFICEQGPTIDYSSDAASVRSSWEGQVDRQGGSFSDQEIVDSLTWR